MKDQRILVYQNSWAFGVGALQNGLQITCIKRTWSFCRGRYLGLHQTAWGWSPGVCILTHCSAGSHACCLRSTDVVQSSQCTAIEGLGLMQSYTAGSITKLRRNHSVKIVLGFYVHDSVSSKEQCGHHLLEIPNRRQFRMAIGWKIWSFKWMERFSLLLGMNENAHNLWTANS
jgi:hypothetical protein